MYYLFKEDEYPFRLSTMLRFLCKSAVLRRQMVGRDRVDFSHRTQVRLVVATPSDDFPIDPYIIASCPVSGSTLRINVPLDERRGLNNRNDAIAYLRKALCKEAIGVTERDIHNVSKYGERGHYTRDFFHELIAKYRFRIDTFHTYNYSVSYDWSKQSV